MKQLVLVVALATSSLMTYAGGIRGTIRGDDGVPLAFATIYVKQTESGSVSDPDGKYEITLPPGQYDLIFHYLGYTTQIQSVNIGAGFMELNVTLVTQVIQLQSVTVKAGKEDPAYTIMRKAIAKAKYHTQQIDKYTAKVYIKGKGQLKDYPWLAKKALEKEGITKDRVFIQESVSEITYTRPNKFDEKVIAIYTNGNNRNTSPNAYVFGSLYEPEIAETISPLSPKSFSYYRFEYEGTFQDRSYAVSKIKVIPRSRGDNVFDGTIYIVEDWWSIHSTELNVTKLGIKFRVKQIYNPIEDKAWLPVSQQFFVEGRIFGFEFVADYLATVKDYKITLNPALPLDMTVIDEKVQQEQAKQVEKKFSKKGQQLQERMEAGKEVTRKELNQLVREYEKSERQEQKAPEVIEETTFKVDPLAYKQDSTFWTEIRPVQLTKEEVRGYKVNDSISEVQKRREEGDSLKPSKSKGFQPWDILIGDRYKLTKTSDLEIHTPWGGFNTVEGWNLIYRMSFYKRWVKRDSLNPESRPQSSRLQITPLARYAFSRQSLFGTLRIDYRTQTRRLTLEGGKYVQQFNSEEPIHPLVNTITTLLLEDNLMKLYQREFVDFKWREQLGKFVVLHSQWTWSRRTELFNATDIKWADYKEKEYTPNAPVNQELASTGFQPHHAFTGSLKIEARPWQKFRVRNGNRRRVSNSSPLFTAEYRRGFGVLNSDVTFDMLELGIRQQLKFGIRGTLDVLVKGGTYFSRKQMYFMDYKHFLGNRTPFVTTDPIGSYRLLDYYAYSTNDKYVTANAHYHFRKLLVTRITYVRLAGITENFFVNYLASPTSGNYTELGYGLDGILRVFRLEFAGAFQGGAYIGSGFRIGISTNLGIDFD
ncbi:MAG: DUF5686 and carboxypeptidase regulatory-like domain-containing protein [Cytophagales bacterium]|nr:DUF5686 and carboxypeptidase regulatory-like domain-containing protein [Cytophagales bacterium]